MISRRSVGSGFLLGVLTGVPALVVMGFVRLGIRIPFAPFSLFDLLARILPGRLISGGIDLMVRALQFAGVSQVSRTAKQVERISGILLFLLVLGLIGVMLAATRRGRNGVTAGIRAGIVAGALLAAAMLVVEAILGFRGTSAPVAAASFLLIFMGWGAVLGQLLRPETTRGSTGEAAAERRNGRGIPRRRILGAGLTAFASLILAYLGFPVRISRRGGGTPPAGAISPAAGTTSGPAASPPAEELADRMPPALGTRPEITSNANFYQVDINSLPPYVDASNWALDLDGMFDRPLRLSLDEIRRRPSASQYATLSCISNPIGGDLISTTLYTGLPLKTLVEEAGLQADAASLSLKSADGYYETVSLEDARDERTLLVYAMNGEPLPVGHGFPLRIYIPNRYGMKQPKWITRITAVDELGSGYWVDRGWDHEAVPKTTSVIDTVHPAPEEDGSEFPAGDSAAATAGSAEPGSSGPDSRKIALGGGIGWAGARGISRIEVQIDDGPWLETRLRVPPLSPLTWVQWRRTMSVSPGRHRARVRAWDGTGTLQVLEPQGTFPSGATGVDAFEFEA